MSNGNCRVSVFDLPSNKLSKLIHLETRTIINVFGLQRCVQALHVFSFFSVFFYRSLPSSCKHLLSMYTPRLWTFVLAPKYLMYCQLIPESYLHFPLVLLINIPVNQLNIAVGICKVLVTVCSFVSLNFSTLQSNISSKKYIVLSCLLMLPCYQDSCATHHGWCHYWQRRKENQRSHRQNRNGVSLFKFSDGLSYIFDSK